MDYTEKAEAFITAADSRTPDMDTDGVAIVSALTAIAYGLLRVAEAIDGHE